MVKTGQAKQCYIVHWFIVHCIFVKNVTVDYK